MAILDTLAGRGEVGGGRERVSCLGGGPEACGGRSDGAVAGAAVRAAPAGERERCWE